MNSKQTPQAELDRTSASASTDSSQRTIVIVAAVVTIAVAYQLFITAQQTGNYEGMWFSLAHTVLVAVATVVALRVRHS